MVGLMIGEEVCVRGEVAIVSNGFILIGGYVVGNSELRASTCAARRHHWLESV